MYKIVSLFRYRKKVNTFEQNRNMMYRIHLIIWLLLIFATSVAAQTDTTLNQTNPKGEKHGKWIKKDNKGNIIYEGRFENGVPVDTFRHYYPEKNKLKAKAIHRNSDELHVKNYYENGKLKAEGKYINRQKDSVWRFYRKEGRLVSEETFKNDVRHGKAVFYFFSGDTLKVTHYKDGELHGKEKVFYEGGDLNKKVVYDEGKLDGVYEVFYPDGDTMTSGAYKDDYKHGVWRYFNEADELIKEEHYQNGKLRKAENYKAD